MITCSKEVDSSTKQEANTSDGKLERPSSSSTPWLRLKDPRIVRVSRAFGVKDRHSKVCTIRGLRDRRVRLSVPTAIQLYDLQDRLGLNQPSKVVDWLLNVAKNEIDELPPLPMPSGNFSLNHQAILSSSRDVGALRSCKVGSNKVNESFHWEDSGGFPRPNFWNSDAFLRAKSNEIARDSVNEKENWTKSNEDDKEENSEGHSAQVPSGNILPRANHLNNVTPYSSFFQLESSNFVLPHLGSHGYATRTEDIDNLNVVPLPSRLSLASGSQILVCQTGTTRPYFPSAPMGIDPRQVDHFQTLASGTQNLFSNSLTSAPYPISQSIRPFHFSVNPRLLHSENGESEPNKNEEFPCKD